MENDLVTIFETKYFIRTTRKLISDSDKLELFLELKNNPKSGDVIRGTGGIRKVRWKAAADRGKSGGIRIIYYFYNLKNILFLLAAYSKNDKIDLDFQERKQLKQLTDELVKTFKEAK